MGHAADLALGIAMAQPERKVICLNGDGSMLMSLGVLATIVESQVRNLILVVVENDSYEITGNQPIPAAGRLDFAALARGAGFRRVYGFDDPKIYSKRLEEVLRGTGPVFAVVKVEPGREGPIHRGADVPELYLQPSLAESAHRFRSHLTGRHLAGNP